MLLHLFSSDGCTKIPGHKEQTEEGEISFFDPEKVYVPGVDNKGLPLDSRVEVGTEVKVGTLLGVRKDFGVPIYSPISGKVSAIVKKKSTVVGRPVDFIEIENDKKGERITLRPLEGEINQANVVAKLKEGGIVGLGGAGFPTFIKYNTKDPIDTILVNAAECEPYLTTDYVTCLKYDLQDMMKALKVLMDALNIKQTFLVTKLEKVKMLEKFQQEVDKFGDPRIKVKGIKSVYPAGFERTMISLALNRTYDKLPSQCGVIVNNFATVLAISRLFFYGETISNKVITISGLVKNPQNVSLPYGTLVKDAINYVGGYTAEKASLLLGGPMCSECQMSDDVPLLIQNDAITVTPVKTIREEPCLHCGNCIAHCPMNLMPVEINDAARRGDFDKCFDLNVLECVNCGTCSFVCPSHIEVSGQVKQAKLMTTIKCPRAQRKPAPAPKKEPAAEAKK